MYSHMLHIAHTHTHPPTHTGTHAAQTCTQHTRIFTYIPKHTQHPQAPEITAELFVEVLGCLANLYLPEFDFFTLVRKHDLLHFLATYAQPGAGVFSLQ